MGISFRLAGCVWCEARVGAQSLNAEAATNMWRKPLLFRLLSVLHTNMCACALKHTHWHTHSGITFLEMPEPSQGVFTKRCSFEKRVRRRMGGDPAWTPTICFRGWSLFGSISPPLIFMFFSCSWRMALRHGTLVMLAIMLMDAIRPWLCMGEWGERACLQIPKSMSALIHFWENLCQNIFQHSLLFFSHRSSARQAVWPSCQGLFHFRLFVLGNDVLSVFFLWQLWK